MRSAVAVLAGLLAGVLVALGVLAALLFVGPDPVGLRTTPSPPPVVAASASPTVSASPSSSAAPLASASTAPSASTGPSPSTSGPAPSGSAGPSASASRSG